MITEDWKSLKVAEFETVDTFVQIPDQPWEAPSPCSRYRLICAPVSENWTQAGF